MPITLCKHDRQIERCEECTPKKNGHDQRLLPGECDLCGKWSGGLREGVCLSCVSFYRLTV